MVKTQVDSPNKDKIQGTGKNRGIQGWCNETKNQDTEENKIQRLRNTVNTGIQKI